MKFFYSKEADGFEKMQTFNDSYLQLTDFGKTPEKYIYDASGTTLDGRTLAIEIKDRDLALCHTTDTYFIQGTLPDGKPYYDSTIMIEGHKAASMYFDAVVNGTVPMYINFMQNGYVVVFNLQMLKHTPTFKQKKIKSIGYDKMEIGQRYFLSMKDAFIYAQTQDNTYRLIHKPDK